MSKIKDEMLDEKREEMAWLEMEKKYNLSKSILGFNRKPNERSERALERLDFIINTNPLG